jgi:hypothetical protein
MILIHLQPRHHPFRHCDAPRNASCYLLALPCYESCWFDASSGYGSKNETKQKTIIIKKRTHSINAFYINVVKCSTGLTLWNADNANAFFLNGIMFHNISGNGDKKSAASRHQTTTHTDISSVTHTHTHTHKLINNCMYNKARQPYLWQEQHCSLLWYLKGTILAKITQ